ncbi:hypothetical protein [Kribbella antiqua]|uniref:hypothetical protein n=1 Tax=Kribbella antiqua TaxID=2512217 RepID=UPI00104EA8B7|nr:hypothetical protein [Kribbella antiqua]
MDRAAGYQPHRGVHVTRLVQPCMGATAYCGEAERLAVAIWRTKRRSRERRTYKHRLEPIERALWPALSEQTI